MAYMPRFDISPLLKTHGKCGNKCLDCEVFRGYCPGCITRDCLVAKCKRGITYVGITYPKEFCTLREYCNSLGRIQPSVKIQDMPRLGVKSTTNLPTFVPVISLIDEKSWFWQDISFPWIVVRLAELVKNRPLLRTVSSKRLHSFLGFGGSILLSTVMEDELLEKLVPSDYLEMIRNIRPDMTMTPDVYTYLDDPLCLSWQQTMKSVEFAASFSELGIPVIGMIKGALENQIGWSAQKQFQLGCQLFALPCRELTKLDLIDHVIMTIMKALHSSGSKIRILLYGLSYPLMKSKERFVYSGLSWFLSARKGVMDSIGILKDMGITSVVMLTGDNPVTADAIARQAGINEVVSELLPEQKVDYVKKLIERGHKVLMVGDGINDAPALATADVGMAMGEIGTDVAIETADIVLMSDDITKISIAIELGRKTLRTIKQNILFATIVNLVGVLLAVHGDINPIIASAIHEGNALLVVLNSARLIRARENVGLGPWTARLLHR